MSSGDMMTRMTKLDESKRLDPFRYLAGVWNGIRATAVVTYIQHSIRRESNETIYNTHLAHFVVTFMKFKSGNRFACEFIRHELQKNERILNEFIKFIVCAYQKFSNGHAWSGYCFCGSVRIQSKPDIPVTKLMSKQLISKRDHGIFLSWFFITIKRLFWWFQAWSELEWAI